MTEAQFAAFAAKLPRRRPLNYRAALQWMLDNDDTEFLDQEDPAISVSAGLVADIYDRTNEEVITDLRRMRGRRQ